MSSVRARPIPKGTLLLLLSQIISPERSRGNYDSAKRLLMERAKTLISTMLSKIVMQTTKTGTDKCKAGLYATLIIYILGCRQEVRHNTLTVVFVGSNPTSPAIFI